MQDRNTPADHVARQVGRALHAREGVSAAWEITFLDAGEGFAHCAMRVREDMLNGHGMAHGGAIFTLADTAFAWACNSRNDRTVAQQASISFLSPAKLGETLTAEARERTLAGRSGVYDVTVRADDGRIVAVFQGLSRAIGGAAVQIGE